MRAILSSRAVWHTYHQASALVKAGYLRKFITGRRRKTRESVIPTNLICNITLPDYLGYAAAKVMPKRRPILNYKMDSLFDLLATKRVEQCDIFHSYNGFALRSMQRAKQYGAICIVESGAHPEEYENIYAEEYAKFGIPWQAIPHQYIDRSKHEFEKADYIFVASKFACDSFVRRGFDENKIRTVPLGYDPGVFSPKSVNKDESVFRILYVGRIGLRKGVHYLIEAFRKLGIKRAQLELVGPIEEDFKMFIHKCPKNCVFRGKVPQAELVDYYNRASVFALPSLAEGSAMVVYEAMACGLPAIVTMNAGAIVRDKKDGFVIPIRDPEAIREKLLFLYEHPAEREQMGIAAREFVQNYTWDHYEQRLIKAYNDIWKEEHRGGSR